MRLPVLIRRSVPAGPGQVEDEAGDRSGEDEADRTSAEGEAAAGGGDREPVGNRGTDWTGDDVGEPEGEDRVHAEAEVADRRDRDDPEEEQDRAEVAEAEGDCSEVAGGGAEGEGGEHGGPVEELAARSGDAVDRERALGDIPSPEDHGEDDRVEDRRGDVGDAEADVEDVGGHRAEDADHRHRQPVGPRHVAVLAELQVEGNAEGDAAEHDGDLGDEAVDEEV